ncbi:FGGY-family carbohydrate kinase [Entomospira culicis]|uniref:Sugar kinase n=1 Tax=Entomospira culicis TaxID=2719989 RepID=A0A968GJS7_9SPIO|nr:FGGY-family carbohydrate kinase [Entomospira culicis]NIZ18930.1 sugar kinase [Entomospira culicis]NIZ69145.1 sugar kinase [Entomospira culicis]WDI37731.1 FGGY-family carbohydrate kinase [Entomospira culicis]WDI39359.1 FGGY-family carbohydrate kinase [Entomospira culicis]
MLTQYFMGIDGGTQSTKVVIVDTKGKTVAQASRALQPMYTTPDGIAEHPADDLFDSLMLTIKDALTHFKEDRSQIIAIGLGSIRYCRCLVKADGTLAHPVISWMDRRISMPYQNDQKDVQYVVATTGYLMGRLTGSFTDTIANCLGQWPIDVNQWKVLENPQDFSSYGISKEMMYEMRMPGEIGGYLSHEIANQIGLYAGIPVVHTANDKAVEALGAGLLNQETVLLSLGTYIASMVVADESRATSQFFWTNMASQPHRYLYESNGIRRGMWTVSWLKNLLGKELSHQAKEHNLSAENYLNKIADNVTVGSEGLICILDWLAPPNEPHKKGMFIGFDQRHTYGHIYRAILEGISLTMRRHAFNMTQELSINPKELVVTGGGSHSDLFMQILADVFAIPVYRTKNESIAGLGAAICAAVATKVYPSFEEAIQHMVERDKTFMPNPMHVEKYAKIAKAYEYLSDNMDTILHHLHDTFEEL